ncbi:unnamed protein product [Linum tenue]|uniref:Major facilitator superfamily (MFS) profile domain-containing protein n=1 Tax=Linum tenue TaxID=586396 RepID=A0AAV0K5L8_9ROSI|nr:unnamed protein product [Linum tenue]
MARDEEATGGRKPPSYGGEVNAFIVTTCIVAAFGGLIFGYDLGISGGVTSMDSFLMKFFPSVYRKEVADQNQNMYCKFDSHLLTLFTSSLYLSALVACMCASTITRKYGRKLSMLSGGLVFLAGAIINAAAVNVAMLIVGRLLLGVGVGFCNQVFPSLPPSFSLNGTGQLSTAAAVLVVVFVTGFVMAFAWSWGPMGWLVPTEICPLELRSAGQAMNAGVNMFFTFVIGQFFLSLLCNLKFGLFFLFAAFVVVMTGFIYFFLPETRNVPIEDMGEVFRRHWFWQKYAAVDDDDNNKGGSAPRRSVELK